MNKDCTKNGKNIDIIIPTLLLTIPSGLSFLCLTSLMIYFLVIPLFKKKEMEKFFTYLIQLDVSYQDPTMSENQCF